MHLITISKLMHDLYYNDVSLKRKRNKIVKRVNKIMEIFDGQILILYLQATNDNIPYFEFRNRMVQYAIDVEEEIDEAFDVSKITISLIYSHRGYYIEYKIFDIYSDEYINKGIFASKEQLRFFLYHAYYDNLILVL